LGIAEVTVRLILAAMLCFCVGGGGLSGVRGLMAPGGGFGSISLYNVSPPAEMEKAARALGATGSMKFNFPNINPLAAYTDVVAKLKSGELSRPIDMGRGFPLPPMTQFNGATITNYRSVGIFTPRR
jgi:hypothetical protein